MINKKEKQMIDNHTRAIIQLSDYVGQIVDYLSFQDKKFMIVEGKLLDEKKDD